MKLVSGVTGRKYNAISELVTLDGAIRYENGPGELSSAATM